MQLDIIKLLQNLAENAHHNSAITNILNQQPTAIKNAFKNNDADCIKSLLPNTQCANELAVSHL